MADSNKVISQIVKAKLKSLGLTRRSLAEAIQSDRTKLNNYLEGKAKWDVNYIRKVFYALDISFDNLFIPKKEPVYPIKNWNDHLEGLIAAEGVDKYEVNSTTTNKPQHKPKKRRVT